MKFALFFGFLLFNSNIFSQTIRVGLYSEENIKAVRFTDCSSNYLLVIDSVITTVAITDTIDISILSGNDVSLSVNGLFFASGKKIELIQVKNKNVIAVSPMLPFLKKRKYEGDFEIHVEKEMLKIINSLDIEDYLKGVIESESGANLDFEYYKVQAVISRTYALKYWDRHDTEGYNMCNTTHCQVYGLKRRGSILIDSAVRQTNGLVMKTEKNDFYPTFFHANCGGQTSETDLVWNEKIDYFNSFKDTFCLKTKQANWEQVIPIKKWNDFLKQKYNLQVDSDTIMAMMSNFEQKNRLGFYLNPSFGIPLRDLRTEFNLKSTFFSTQVKDDFIYLKGKGNGHGVGLCQEGAIIMASIGYDYKQILGYYYSKMHLERNIKLINSTD